MLSRETGLGQGWLSLIQPVGPDVTRHSPAFWGQVGTVAGWLPDRKKVSQFLSWVLLLNKRKLAQFLYPDSIWQEVFSGVTLGASTLPLSWSGHSQTLPVTLFQEEMHKALWHFRACSEPHPHPPSKGK